MQRTLLAGLGALTLVAATPSLSPAPIFIKMDGIPGEATAPGFEDFLRAETLEWVRPCPSHVTVAVDGADPAACQCGADTCSPPELVVTKVPSPSSPRLMRLHGAALDTEGLNPPIGPISAEIQRQTNNSATGAPYVQMLWELEDVRVTSYGLKVESNDMAVEEIGLSFGAVRQTFFPADGSPPISQGFILEAGTMLPQTPVSGMVVLGDDEPAREAESAVPTKPEAEQVEPEDQPEAETE